MIDRLNLYFLLLVSVNIAFLSGWICECILWINNFLWSVLLQLVILCICYIFIVIKIMFYAIYMTEIIWIIHWWKRNNLNKVWQLVIQTFGHLFLIMYESCRERGREAGLPTVGGRAQAARYILDRSSKISPEQSAMARGHQWPMLHMVSQAWVSK